MGGSDVTSGAKKRIGILVVAYNAATTLAKVLDRIPVEIRSDIEEVIVSDDHSQDSTYLVGLGYQQVSDLPITLIRQPTNLGYGGNQKAGYDLAIVAGRLGHRDPTITLRVYAHALERRDRDMANSLGQALAASGEPDPLPVSRTPPRGRR